MLFEFHESFCKGAAVAQVAAGHHDPIRDFPASDSSTRNMIVFWPSSRKGLMLLTK